MDLMLLRRRIIMASGSLKKFIVTAASGIVSFLTNVAKPTKVTCEFSPVQSGTGDPSPSNVRSISGWTGCEISHSGADTSVYTTLPINFTDQGSPLTVYGGTVTLNEDGSADLVRKYQLVDGGNQTWTKITNNSYRNFAFTWSRAEQNNMTVTVWSDHYMGVATNKGATVDGDNYVWIRAKSGSGSSAQPQQCCVKDTAHASLTATQFKTLMTGVEFLGLLNEKYWTTTHFSNIGQLQSFIGQNAIWHDMNGSITVEYYKNT